MRKHASFAIAALTFTLATILFATSSVVGSDTWPPRKSGSRTSPRRVHIYQSTHSIRCGKRHAIRMRLTAHVSGYRVCFEGNSYGRSAG